MPRQYATFRSSRAILFAASFSALSSVITAHAKALPQRTRIHPPPSSGGLC
jgi:hypothetical protein